MSETTELSDLLASDFLQCGVCSKAYTDPIVLPCLHTMCKACVVPSNGPKVNGVKDNEEEEVNGEEEEEEGEEKKKVEKEEKKEEKKESTAECPVCSAELTQNGQPYQKDFFLSSLQALADCHSEGEKKCDYCKFDSKEVKASHRCLECQDNICTNCMEAHRRTKVTRDHKVAEFKDIQAGKYNDELRELQQVKCQDHENESVKYFCTKCDTLICRECRVGEHDKHYCVSLQHAGEKYNNQVQKLLRSVTSKVPGIEQYGQFLADYKQHIDEVEAKMNEEIEKEAADLHELVEAHKANLQQKLGEAVRDERKQLDEKCTTTDHTLLSIKANVEYLEKLMQHGKAEEILAVRNVITDRLTKLVYLQTERLTKKLSLYFNIGSQNMRNMDIIFGKVDIYHVPLNNESVQQISKSDVTVSAAMPDIGEGIELVQEFECRGHHDTKDIWPTGVDIDHDGNVVILDRENKKVKVFDMHGVLLNEFGNTADCMLGCPYDLAVTPEGEIALTDYDKEEVRVFTREGKMRNIIKGPFKYPRGLTVTNDGRIMVVDCHSRQVTVHRPETGKVDTIIGGKGDDGYELFTDPYYVTTNHAGHVIVTDWASPNVRIFDQSGRQLTKYGTYGSRRDQVLQPYGVCSDAFGYIFVADNQNHRIHLLAPDGRFIRFLITKSHGLWHPMALAINQQGHLVVTEALGCVKMFKYL